MGKENSLKTNSFSKEMLVNGEVTVKWEANIKMHKVLLIFFPTPGGSKYSILQNCSYN